MYKHNASIWFSEIDGGKGFLDYYQDHFDAALFDKMKLPPSLIKNFNNLATQQDLYNLLDSIANRIINTIISLPECSIMNQIRFEWLLPFHQEGLCQLVCDIFEYGVMNNKLVERTDASSISVGNFSSNMDQTNFVFNKDSLGARAIERLRNLKMQYYKIGDNKMYHKQLNGNVQVIGWFDADKLPELV